MTMRARFAACSFALVALLGSATVGVSAAHAQASSRAVVIVSTGSGVHTNVIEFSGTVSGLEALQLAGASPETITYGPLGQAVCKLYGAGDEPVPGQCPGGWVYYRAVGGAGGWSQSSLGASNSVVHDGDVEGWGYGGAPPFSSFCAVAGCAPPPAPETTAPAVTPGGAGTSAIGSPANTPAGDGSATPATGDAGSGSATPTTAASDGSAAKQGGGNGATAAGAGTSSRQQRVTRALRPTTSASEGGGGSPVGVIVAVVVVAALVGAGLLLRRRRAGT